MIRKLNEGLDFDNIVYNKVQDIYDEIANAERKIYQLFKTIKGNHYDFGMLDLDGIRYSLKLIGDKIDLSASEIKSIESYIEDNYE